MLKGLGISNFKAFNNEVDLNFKKINVFLGPNSSGKSSFLKSMYLTRDSIDSQNKEIVMNFSSEIGDFYSIINNKNREEFNLKFYFDNTDVLELNSKTLVKAKMPFILGAFLISNKTEATLKDLDEFLKEIIHDYKNNYVEKVSISIIKNSNVNEVLVNYLDLIFLDKSRYRIKMASEGYELIKFKDDSVKEFNAKNLFKPSNFLFEANDLALTQCSKEDVKEVLFVNLALLNIRDTLESYFNNLSVVGPLRYKPSRIEHVSSLKNSVNSKGSDLVSALAKLNNEKSKLLEKINDWLFNFDLGKSVELMEWGNDQYSIQIRNKFTNVLTNINDVGIGTSQLLPIIVESILSKDSSVLIIEEPETHIHPNAQARLADLFVERIIEENKRFFIETHSMYFIQRLQILVARGIIHKSDIGIFYFDQDEKGTNILELTLNDNGQFNEDFPKGFFDVAFELSKQLMKSIRKK